MDLLSYQLLLREKISDTLQIWYKEAEIPYDELYSFLHMITATALTIGMDECGKEALVAMEHIKDEAKQVWTRDEWAGHLSFLFDQDHGMPLFNK
ncbi:hypothetical protein [Jeotgalibacillus soli]|uniref:Uncharacterized protein n=1 Tax=Jeotgalibacillus soli TaxID=889306 RepID=A0A0C2V8M6_9BACL|nr:hypothetical protein [Jeotgalibacillus soli]KIL45312.1 hypothetical protein KP78_28560 [Jeotgalibacillus soli]